jgi:hypothetical protein
MAVSPVAGQIQLDLNKISGDLLLATKMNQQKEIENAKAFLEGIEMDQLIKNLDTDDKKKAFWINVYNSYIIIKLAEDSTRYDNRGDFFSAKSITIANHDFSFDFIEHGILRRSKVKLSLGFFGKLFPSKLERQLRVDKLDYRIHFALNCGAASCPPVAFYDADKIEEQLAIAEASFVMDKSTYDKETNTVNTSALFSWFRGDFGRKRGIRKIIRKHLAIEEKRFALKFDKYDWGMDLENFKNSQNEPVH